MLSLARSRRALSLIEMVLALFLFFCTATLVFGVIPACHKAADLGLKRSLARQLAQETMNILRTLAYNEVVASGPTDVPVSATRNGEPVSITLEVRVEVSEPVPGEVKDALVTVAWEGHQVELEGLLVSP